MPASREQDHEYSQSIFEGLGSVEQEETLLYNCLVLEQPRFSDTGVKQEWLATVHARHHPECCVKMSGQQTSREMRLSQPLQRI